MRTRIINLSILVVGLILIVLAYKSNNVKIFCSAWITCGIMGVILSIHSEVAASFSPLLSRTILSFPALAKIRFIHWMKYELKQVAWITVFGPLGLLLAYICSFDKLTE